MVIVDHTEIWLAAGDPPGKQPPSNSTWLQDMQLGRLWVPDGRGNWHTEDNREHATLPELRARYDLAAVIAR